MPLTLWLRGSIRLSDFASSRYLLEISAQLFRHICNWSSLFQRSVTDKNKATATKSTDTNGKITVPVKSTGGGSSSGGGGGRGGSSGGGYYTSVNVKITDKDGKAVTNFSKSTDSKGN